MYLMGVKLQAANDNAPRCMKRRDVAAHFGIKPSTFSRWVSIGVMPKPIPGTRKWDKLAIEEALKLAGRLTAGNDNESEADRWFRESQNARRA